MLLRYKCVIKNNKGFLDINDELFSNTKKFLASYLTVDLYINISILNVGRILFIPRPVKPDNFFLVVQNLCTFRFYCSARFQLP